MTPTHAAFTMERGYGEQEGWLVPLRAERLG